jgi:restriction system protein
MRAWLSKRNLVSSIQDLIGIKTGLIISVDDIYKLLIGTSYEDFIKQIQNATDGMILTIRGEEFEELISKLRVKLGNSDKERPSLLSKLVLDFPEYEEDIINLISAFSEIIEGESNKPIVIDQEFHNKLTQKSDANHIITFIFIKNTVQYMDHSASNSFSAQNWDGKVPLSDLFDSENLPNREELFIDQRFIDYLNVHQNESDKIHWRQFEGLVAEFFNRNGYKVTLGEGRNDGGIDIYAVKDNEISKKPEAIIIQCKRYKRTNKVGVNYVKALYFDVVDKSVDRAIIATTSYLEPAGKRICDSKKYPITYAELDKINTWIQNMKSNNIFRY